MTAQRRILVVEDDRDLADAYSLVLDAQGFEVDTAGTGQSALERLGGDAPHVVVADLGLPDVSGADLVRRLRASAPEARLVVLTGEADDETRRECVDAGADDYLVKPVSGTELARELVED